MWVPGHDATQRVLLLPSLLVAAVVMASSASKLVCKPPMLALQALVSRICSADYVVAGRSCFF